MTTRTLIREIKPGVTLFRDDRSGLAWIEDTITGCGHSGHPNIDETGSVEGMRAQGYWGKRDRVVHSHGFVYNIDRSSITDELDQLAAAECRCGGRHPATTEAT